MMADEDGGILLISNNQCALFFSIIFLLSTGGGFLDFSFFFFGRRIKRSTLSKMFRGQKKKVCECVYRENEKRDTNKVAFVTPERPFSLS